MNTTLFKIRNRWTNAVIFDGQYESLKMCVIDAVAKKSNLRGCNLSGSNLSATHGAT